MSTTTPAIAEPSNIASPINRESATEAEHFSSSADANHCVGMWTASHGLTVKRRNRSGSNGTMANTKFGLGRSRIAFSDASLLTTSRRESHQKTAMDTRHWV